MADRGPTTGHSLPPSNVADAALRVDAVMTRAATHAATRLPMRVARYRAPNLLPACSWGKAGSRHTVAAAEAVVSRRRVDRVMTRTAWLASRARDAQGWLEYAAAVAVCVAVYLLASSCAASSGAPDVRFGPPVIQPVPAAWYAPALPSRKGTGSCTGC